MRQLCVGSFTPDPCFVDPDVTGIEGDHVGAITGGDPAERCVETEKARGLGGRVAQGLRQGHLEEPYAIPHRRGHVEGRPRQRAVVSRAAAIVDTDFLAVERKCRCAPADRRHRVRHQHGTSRAPQIDRCAEYDGTDDPAGEKHPYIQ